MQRAEPNELSPLRWEDLTVGAVYGPYAYTPDERALALWAQVYNRELSEGPVVPAGLVPIAVLKALREAFDGIPPGGVLARQTFRFGSQPPFGETLSTSVAIADKYERRGRPFVTFVFTSTISAGSQFVAESRQTLIWPRRHAAPTEGSHSHA
jgi:hypothetical protein